MPWAVDVFQVPDPRGVARRRLVDHGAPAQPPRTQRAALMRAEVRDRVERPGDVVDAEAVVPDRREFMGAGGDVVGQGAVALTVGIASTVATMSSRPWASRGR